MKAKSKCTPASELRPRNGVEGYLTASAAAIWGDFLAFPIDTLKVISHIVITSLMPRLLLNFSSRDPVLFGQSCR
jgi:hypothetical protein